MHDLFRKMPADFLHFNMSFDALPVYFRYQGATWLIELWKGQYGVSTGAEVGVYRADGLLAESELSSALFHAVDDGQYLPMSFTLRRNGTIIARICKSTWWLTAFLPGLYSRSSSLTSGWKLNRFLVRYLWRPLEHFGVLDPTSAAKNYSHKDLIEKRLTAFALSTGIPLITGHTHKPRLNPSDLSYMNTGSCVHPRCITCMELIGNQLTLVKWTYDTRRDRTLFVSREILSQATL
mgnify:CR=1 FL=1